METTRYLPFVGRLLIGLPFAMSGLGKLAAFGPTTAMIAAVGLPVPPLAYAVAVVIELGGGLLLVAGYQTRLVAIALAVFAIATAMSKPSTTSLSPPMPTRPWRCSTIRRRKNVGSSAPSAIAAMWRCCTPTTG